MRRVLFVLVTAAAFCSAAAAVVFLRPGPERRDAEAELKPVRGSRKNSFDSIGVLVCFCLRFWLWQVIFAAN